jgi:hypothetical protein
MKIDNIITYNEVINIEDDLNKGLDALLTLQNYYDIKNIPIAAIEHIQDMLFQKRTDFDKKRLKKL